MKRYALRTVCLIFVLALCLPLVACDMQFGGLIGELIATGTQTAPEILEEIPADAPEVIPDQTIAEKTTQAPQTEIAIETEVIDEMDTIAPDYNPDSNVINIGSAQELIDWANTIHGEQQSYDGVTINFYRDIDLSGYNWMPIDGAYLKNVTFEGNGHTISNMTIEGNDNITPDATVNFPYGIGFIQNAAHSLTFSNLTFDSAHITAWERHAGVIIGNVYGSTDLSFINVHVTNSTINGWMEYLDQETHNVCFRVGGFVGAIMAGGYCTFDACSVSNTQFNGFHNIAGFVGYDATGVLTASCFANCSVDEVTITFSYCQADSYSVDMPRKFVTVFFNAYDWVDNVDEFEQYGNAYHGITYIDYTTGQSYNPDNFRSWTYEQAHP